MDLLDILIDIKQDEYYKSEDIILTCISKYHKVLNNKEWDIEIYMLNPDIDKYTKEQLLKDDLFWLRVFPELSVQFNNHNKDIKNSAATYNKIYRNCFNSLTLNYKILNRAKLKIPRNNLKSWWKENNYSSLFDRHYLYYKKTHKRNNSNTSDMSFIDKLDMNLKSSSNDSIKSNDKNNDLKPLISNNKSCNYNSVALDSSDNELFKPRKGRRKRRTKKIIDDDRHVVKTDIFNFLYQFYSIRYFRIIFYPANKIENNIKL